MASSSVVSIAERLKQRREELGISQSQAARELDVARTAYRLWEMEAARPAPDRWRLIASWLGVSVTTMLLAEELMSEDEAQMAEVTQLAAFARSGVDWDAAAAEKPGDFFEQARALIADGTESGDITSEQAEAFAFLIQRIEQERTERQTNAWEEAELRKSFAVDDRSPRAAREAVAVLTADLPDQVVAAARLLVSELVANSLKHGPSGPGAKVGLYAHVERNRLRVEVSDGSAHGARPRPADDAGGYGLLLVDSLSSRWDTCRHDDRNVTWFELDLPPPGR